MDPVTMALLGKAAIGITQGLAGAATSANRPKYRIPKAEREALALARIRAADTQMPGEQRAVDRAMIVGSNSVRAAQESGNAMEALAGISAGTQGNLADIAAQSAQFQNQDLNNLDSALSRNADYQDQAWQINQYAPYAQKYELKQQLLGAGMTNAMGALDSYAGKSFVQPPKAADLGSTASGNFPGSDMYGFAMKSAKMANQFNTYANANPAMSGIAETLAIMRGLQGAATF